MPEKKPNPPEHSVLSEKDADVLKAIELAHFRRQYALLSIPVVANRMAEMIRLHAEGLVPVERLFQRARDGDFSNSSEDVSSRQQAAAAHDRQAAEAVCATVMQHVGEDRLLDFAGAEELARDLRLMRLDRRLMLDLETVAQGDVRFLRRQRRLLIATTIVPGSMFKTLWDSPNSGAFIERMKAEGVHEQTIKLLEGEIRRQFDLVARRATAYGGTPKALDQSVRNHLMEVREYERITGAFILAKEGLVHHLVHKFSQSGIPIDDLKGVAREALVDRIESHDPRLGLAFSTHASIRINGALINYQEDVHRVSNHMTRTQYRVQEKVRQVKNALYQELETDNIPLELIAKRAELDLSVVRDIEMAGYTISAETINGEDQEIKDTLAAADDTYRDSQRSGAAFFQAVIAGRSLADLTMAEERLLSLRDEFPDISVAKAAEELGLSELECAITEKRALEKVVHGVTAPMPARQRAESRAMARSYIIDAFRDALDEIRPNLPRVEIAGHRWVNATGVNDITVADALFLDEPAVVGNALDEAPALYLINTSGDAAERFSDLVSGAGLATEARTSASGVYHMEPLPPLYSAAGVVRNACHIDPSARVEQPANTTAGPQISLF